LLLRGTAIWLSFISFSRFITPAGYRPQHCNKFEAGRSRRSDFVRQRQTSVAAQLSIVTSVTPLAMA